MKKIGNKILFLLNIAVAVGLLFSYLGTHISPAVIWPLAFFGLIFTYLLLANIAFILYWVILWNKKVFLSLIVIILGFNHVHHSIPVLRLNRETKQTEGNDLRILSYNVRSFNLYEWLNDPNTNKGIFNFIRSEHPDVICLQEFYSSNSLSPSSINYLRLFGDHPYKHIEYSSREKNAGHGIATFSKYPIVRKGIIPFQGSNNMSIYTDILFYEDTIRIFNNHLQSVNFRDNNYRLINRIGKSIDPPAILEIRSIFSLLKTAYIKRAEQTDMLHAIIKNSPYPVIICGDFNDTPVSYTYRKIKKGLKDAFLTAGKGRGNTYLGRLSFRIDYILYSPDFEAIEFEKVEANLSDHYPIISVLRK